LINLGLDAWFILGLGWAAYGAGLATAIAQWLQLGVAIAFFWGRRGGVGLDWTRIFDLERFRSMFGLQRDILIRTLCLVSALALFTDFSARLGTTALAANALLLKIVTSAAFFIDGAAYAVETLAGIFHGRADHPSLRRLVRLAIATGLGLAAVIAGTVVLAPFQTLGLLTHHTDVVELGASLAFWLLPVLLLGSVAYILDGLFIGLTDGRTLRNAMLVSVGVAYLPIAFWALHAESLHGLWTALAVFMLARIVTLGRATLRLPAYRKPHA
ncbi:MAG: MATE family efflux transporter, partial [Acidobacteriota bacterium]